MEEILCTSELEIRPFSPEDLGELSRLLKNEQIQKTYMIPDLSDPGVLDRLLCRFLELSHSPARFVRGIYREEMLVGLVNDVELEGGSVELGYAISPEFWGRGYATQMLRAVMGELFAAGFTRVTAGAFEDNAASLRVMEKAGMRRIPRQDTVIYRGEARRCVYYALTSF